MNELIQLNSKLKKSPLDLGLDTGELVVEDGRVFVMGEIAVESSEFCSCDCCYFGEGVPPDADDCKMKGPCHVGPFQFYKLKEE